MDADFPETRDLSLSENEELAGPFLIPLVHLDPGDLRATGLLSAPAEGLEPEMFRSGQPWAIH